jgi:hypothetical protein
MGLEHSIETQIGIPATYFHIQRLDLYPRDNVMDITVYGFINQEARLNGASYIYTWGQRVSYGDITQTDDVTQAQVYTYLKTREPFLGAIDK